MHHKTMISKQVMPSRQVDGSRARCHSTSLGQCKAPDTHVSLSERPQGMSWVQANLLIRLRNRPRRIPPPFGLRHFIRRQAAALADVMSLQNGITHMTFTLTASSLDFPSHLNHTTRDAVSAILLVRYTTGCPCT